MEYKCDLCKYIYTCQRTEEDRRKEYEDNFNKLFDENDFDRLCEDCYIKVFINCGKNLVTLTPKGKDFYLEIIKELVEYNTIDTTAVESDKKE